MRAPLRLFAWTLVAAGLLAGAGAPERPREPRRYGPEVILAIDFHVHSFPGDGVLPPWDLASEAARRGLDAIALTNHNNRLAWHLVQLLSWPGSGALLIPGEELTSAGYHMAAVGSARDVTWRQSAAAAVAAIHAQGGVAIAAHPGSDATGFDAAALDVLDGVEAAHPMVYGHGKGRAELEAFYARALARRSSMAAIGSSDFHFFAPVGVCRTFVFARDRTIAGILDAVRRGRTVSCDGRGAVHGPAELAAAVQAACSASLDTPDEGSWLGPASVVGLWLGLALLIASGADEPGLK